MKITKFVSVVSFPFGVHIWSQICNLDVYCLILFIFWRNGTDAIRNFISSLWNVFAFNAENIQIYHIYDNNNVNRFQVYSLRNVNKNVIATFRWDDKSMTLITTKTLDGALNQRVSHSAIRSISY